MKPKIVILLCFFIGIIALLPLNARSGSPSGDGALVVLDAPSYPYTLWVWEDAQGSGLTVAVAMRDGSGFPFVIPEPGDSPTLDHAVEIFLPDTATKFTPVPFVPDTIRASAVDVPVAVFEATESEIFYAYVDPENNEGVLEDTMIASGFVKVQWSGKAFKAISIQAIGPVGLVEGGDAILVATGYELYDNPYDEPFSYFYKVELH